MLSALCSVGRFVAEAAKNRMVEGGARFEGHMSRCTKFPELFAG
jgi:hypothetical protein